MKNRSPSLDHGQWQDRWRQGQIGFHLEEVNPVLIRHADSLPGLPVEGRILVPLCGKSLDLVWLRERGYGVLGVELSELAVRAFFEEQGWKPRIAIRGAFTSFRVSRLEVLCGDFFELDRNLVGELAGAFDRAALIALSEASRPLYAELLARWMPPGSRTVLVSIDYPQGEMKGPPFSLPEARVRELFEPLFEVHRLQREELDTSRSKFRKLSRLHESAYCLSRLSIVSSERQSRGTMRRAPREKVK